MWSVCRLLLLMGLPLRNVSTAAAATATAAASCRVRKPAVPHALRGQSRPCVPPALQNLRLEAAYLSDSVLRLKLTDAADKRWEVPTWLLRSELLPGSGGARKAAAATQPQAPATQQAQPALSGAGSGSSSGGGKRSLSLAVQREPFSLEVTRAGGAALSGAAPGATVFNTTGTRLVYKARCWMLGLPGYCVAGLAGLLAESGGAPWRAQCCASWQVSGRSLRPQRCLSVSPGAHNPHSPPPSTPTPIPHRTSTWS